MTHIDEVLIRLEEQLKAHRDAVTVAHGTMQDKLDAVLIQTTKTNGRVDELESWRHRLKGAWAAIVIISAVLGAFIGWVVASKYII